MQPSAAPGRPVLVVDDDAVIRRVVAAALREEGYAVAQAPDGAPPWRWPAPRPPA